MTDLKTTLAVRKAIDRQIDHLIRAAAQNVARLAGSDMEENQIRNVLNVASTTESMEAVTNFIRYQIGRDTRGNTWGSNGFGKAVIADIETGAVKQALDAVKAEVPAADTGHVRAQLTELYLGYLNRCFVYAKKSGDWQNLSGRIAGQGGGT
ncbi:MAG: hypothetical protein NZT92_18635 [Abditibacteriales bacterium]|nr:hypothetical protein [Abditibacteriales bacterium]MDW8367659.1 hypothetical protein [Abditibacteriales bacterium]